MGAGAGAVEKETQVGGWVRSTKGVECECRVRSKYEKIQKMTRIEGIQIFENIPKSKGIKGLRREEKRESRD